MNNFNDWWPTQNQTIGKVAAKAAWDYQQARVDELEQGIKDHIGWAGDHIDTTDLEILVGLATENEDE